MKQITDYLKAHEQRFIDELVEYLRFPSVSAQSVHKKDMIACGRRRSRQIDRTEGQGAKD